VNTILAGGESVFRNLFGLLGAVCRSASRSPSGAHRRSTVRLTCTPLEERLAPAVFDIANFDVPGLVAAITTANANNQADTINLAPGGSYVLTEPMSISGSGLLIAGDGGNPLAINGNGATILRAPGAPAFRILEVQGGKLTLDRATLANGSTGTFGGGIVVVAGSTLSLSNSAVVNNTAFAGGRIYLDSRVSATIINSTISGNSASAGGGIVLDKSSLTILNSTVAHNTATTKGGGIDVSPDFAASLTLESTIVADNTAPEGADLFRFGGTVNATRSLIENPQAGAINGTNTDNIIGQDPMLGPLQDNGGPTPTHALLAGSPAIDHGSNPAFLPTDQRGPGFARVQGAAPDIGAFEADPATPVATAVASPAASPGSLPQPFFFLFPQKVRKGKSQHGVREQQMILINSFAGPLRGRFLLSLDGLTGLQLLGASIPPPLQTLPVGGNQLLIDFGPDGLPPGMGINLLLTLGKANNNVLFFPRLTFLG
jgi:hypothetical protein